MRYLISSKLFWFMVITYLAGSATLILSGHFLDDKLLEFVGFMLLACTFLPLPADSYLLYVSPSFVPAFAAITGGIINTVAVIAERKFVEKMLIMGWAP